LKLEDIQAITPETAPAVQNASPEIQNQTQIKSGNQNTDTTVFGVWPSWLEIRNYQVAIGRFFTEDEDKKRTKVCVLGWNVYQQLFPEGGDPTGKLVRVNNVGVRCIGVLAEKGQSGNANPDDIVVVPAGTASKRLFNFWQGRPRSFSVQAVSEDKMGEAAEQIRRAVPQALPGQARRPVHDQHPQPGRDRQLRRRVAEHVHGAARRASPACRCWWGASGS
jgi:putative ABC transport system permease protein